MGKRSNGTVCGMLLAALWAGNAIADPVTYAGKLGTADIVVELTDNPLTAGSALAGRYFYRSQGIDIPLQAGKRSGKGLSLREEEACNAEACGEGKVAPLAATWTLSIAGGGRTLTGTWAAKKAIKIALTRVDSRPQPEDDEKSPLGLYLFSAETFFPDSLEVTQANSPYDTLKLDYPLQQGPAQGWPDGQYRFVSDPRSKFLRPRIVSAGTTPIAPTNTLLDRQHRVETLSALNCAALRYSAFRSGSAPDSTDDGSLGGFDETSAEVTFLSPRLMGWEESGSVYCGGAHPENFIHHTTIDVAAGKELGLADIFTDVADGKPGRSLVSFVEARRKKPKEQFEIDFETECGISELVGEYLSAYLKRTAQGEILVFSLSDLPHAIMACGDDLLELPVKDVKDLLTPRFAGLLGL